MSSRHTPIVILLQQQLQYNSGCSCLLLEESRNCPAHVQLQEQMLQMKANEKTRRTPECPPNTHTHTHQCGKLLAGTERPGHMTDLSPIKLKDFHLQDSFLVHLGNQHACYGQHIHINYTTVSIQACVVLSLYNENTANQMQGIFISLC